MLFLYFWLVGVEHITYYYTEILPFFLYSILILIREYRLKSIVIFIFLYMAAIESLQ